MDISRPHSPIRSRLATTTSISCHAAFSNKNNMTNQLLDGLDTFKNVYHDEAKAALPHIFASTRSLPRKLAQSFPQRDEKTNPKPESLSNLVREPLSIIQIPFKQTNIGNLGELSLIHALIDDLSARLIHYRKIKDEHYKLGLCHSQICDARRKTCKLKNRNTCSWKLVLMWPFSINILPPATQRIPDLRVTNHQGNVYSLEEIMPDMDAQDFKEHVEKRKKWGESMEEYLYKSYGADPAWCHKREMHFRQWREEIEGNEKEETQNEKIDVREIKGFIPMDTIFEEPEDDETDGDVKSESESSNDNTLGGLGGNPERRGRGRSKSL